MRKKTRKMTLRTSCTYRMHSMSIQMTDMRLLWMLIRPMPLPSC